ncbi:MAG TPA: site-2 protease family protein [Candidatus Limnocylindrales bacterium]
MTLRGDGAPTLSGRPLPTGRPIARLFGLEVRVNLGWILVLAVIGYLAYSTLDLVQPPIDRVAVWVLSILVALGFFLTSAAHDLAHALMARRRGVPVTGVSVSFFGGASPLDPPAEDPRTDLAIALAGPAASIAIGLVLGAITLILNLAATAGSALELVVATLAVISGLNLLVGVVNLVPGYPLDGGRIVRAIAWRRTGRIDSGWRAAAITGRIAGYVVIGGGLIVMAAGPFTNGAMTALSGWFLVLSSRQINDRVRVNRLIGGLHVKDAMETSTVSVGPNLTVDTFAGQLLDGEGDMTAVPVVSDGDVVGLLGARQLRRLQRRLWATTRVGDVMAKPPRLVLLSALDSLEGAVERLYRAGLDGLPVVEDGALVGVLTRTSVGKLVHERSDGVREGGSAA